MGTKQEFLDFPIKEFCTSIASVSPPRGGKTWNLIGSLKYWMKNKTFHKYYLVLPQYKNEMMGSYDFLRTADKKTVIIHEIFSDGFVADILKEQEMYCDLYDKGKIKAKPRVFFAVDDATSQTNIFNSELLIKLVTENRHLQIHSWFLCHAIKKVIDSRVRQNFQFFLLYSMKKKLLEMMYEDFVDFPEDFEDYKEFYSFFVQRVRSQKYGCLLINGSENYNPDVCKWFPK